MALLWFIKFSISHVLPLSAKKLPTALDVLSTYERYDLYCSLLRFLQWKLNLKHRRKLQIHDLSSQNSTYLSLFHADVVSSLLNVVVLIFVYHVIHILICLSGNLIIDNRHIGIQCIHSVKRALLLCYE